jgi:hypothetical protein
VPTLRRYPVFLLALLLAAQIAWNGLTSPPTRLPEQLPAPPAIDLVRLLSLNELSAASALLCLYLQSFDTQPGASLPFEALDYKQLLAWLTRLAELDPASNYPFLLAAQVYAQVPNPEKQRMTLQFIYAHFPSDPERRWPWLAHAAVMAKHRLKDPGLALKYATAVAQQAKNAPGWARQMPAFILEDMGEVQQAKILLGALLAEGQVPDPQERRFLLRRLGELERFSAEPSTEVSK